jgi:hypothetical protein
MRRAWPRREAGASATCGLEPRSRGGVYGPGLDPGRDLRPEASMRSILLFAIGVPLPIILLLAFCTHHF